MTAFQWAAVVGIRAARQAWRDARGNPNIRYRFRVGDPVWSDLPPGSAPTTVIRRCWCDESYDLDNGWTCPGYSLRKR